MFNEEMHFSTPIRWGMVGGGRGSEIGYAHRSAAARDRLFQLVAGAFDVDAARCVEFGENLGLDGARCYADYQQLFAQEALRDDGIEAVSIAVPNVFHYPISKAALEAGLHVICEKPLSFTLQEALELKALAQQKNRIFAVMYGYSGYPMLHQARRMIEHGDLGDIRIVTMQFAHGFHNLPVEEFTPGAKWRMTAEVAGPSYVLGDLGTHTFYLMQLLTGLKVSSLSCMRQSFVKTRAPLEDNAHVMMQLNNGAVATLWASAVNAGSTHKQKIRVVGEKASIEWWDEHPNQLIYEVQGKPAQMLDRGMPYLYEDDAICHRIGAGHAEGFFDAWANLYHRYGLAIQAKKMGDEAVLDSLWYPNIEDGISGVRFVESCVKSADNGAAWVQFGDY